MKSPSAAASGDYSLSNLFMVLQALRIPPNARKTHPHYLRETGSIEPSLHLKYGAHYT
jgi:hypothetical protein